MATESCCTHICTSRSVKTLKKPSRDARSAARPRADAALPFRVRADFKKRPRPLTPAHSPHTDILSYLHLEYLSQSTHSWDKGLCMQLHIYTPLKNHQVGAENLGNLSSPLQSRNFALKVSCLLKCAAGTQLSRCQGAAPAGKGRSYVKRQHTLAFYAYRVLGRCRTSAASGFFSIFVCWLGGKEGWLSVPS